MNFLIYDIISRLPEYKKIEDETNNISGIHNMDKKVYGKLIGNDRCIYMTNKITLGEYILVVVYIKYNKNQLCNSWTYISVEDLVSNLKVDKSEYRNLELDRTFKPIKFNQLALKDGIAI